MKAYRSWSILVFTISCENVVFLLVPVLVYRIISIIDLFVVFEWKLSWKRKAICKERKIMASNTILLYSHSHANPESSIYKISGNNNIHPYSSMTNPGLSINPARRSTSSRYSSVFPSLLENLASQQSQTKRNNKVLRFSVEEKENKWV